MKLSETWLRQWVNPPLSADQLAEQLTMLGLEVNTVDCILPDFDKVVVGEVLSVAPHPSANRLRQCVVNVGAIAPLNIICGADNVRPHLKVAVVLIGGMLKKTIKIKATKLRGLVSEGMICSEFELDLALEQESKGIMELPKSAPVGQNLADYLDLYDTVFDIELTPNRGDCASVLGIAREVAAINQRKVDMPADEQVVVSEDLSEVMSVSVLEPEACLHYVGRVIKGMYLNVKTPYWMRERVSRSGLQLIHPIVDIMNYVMLELGQPLHAFDLAALSRGGMVVRWAHAEEVITALNGQVITLDEHTLVIADGQQVQAIAGVMGGLAAAVNEKTCDVFLESAVFSPKYVTYAARRYGMPTEAAYRFERGVDFDLQHRAIERVSVLLRDILGGSFGPVIDIASSRQPLLRIDLKYVAIERLLGVRISEIEVKKILTYLGMTLTDCSGGWCVEVPSYRFDLIKAVDLIEEVARMYGYHRIASTLMHGQMDVPNQDANRHLLLSKMRHLFVSRDYVEIVTYGFVSALSQKLLDSAVPVLQLVNPMTQEMAVMRHTLWSGLLSTLKYNEARQMSRIRLFEIGMCFRLMNDQVDQQLKLAGVITGDADPLQWGKEKRSVDFYDIKGDVVLFLQQLGHAYTLKEAQHPALHPNQCMQIDYEGCCIGFFGALSPELMGTLSLTKVPYLFELTIDAIKPIHRPIQYQAISKFPMVRRDLAIVVPVTSKGGEIIEEIRRMGEGFLSEVAIFDIYEGKGIPDNYKSVAFDLVFQNNSRTLIDKEINECIERILFRLKRQFDAKLR